MTFNTLTFSQENKEVLLSRFLQTPEVTPLASDPKFFSLIVSIGIQQEIGTIHDELSVFLFDSRTGMKIDRSRLRAEVIEYRNYFGVRIWAEGSDSLDPRVKGMRTLLHPEFSFSSAGEIHQLVFFPEVIGKIATLEGVELVSVRPWGMNTVFGGFDRSKPYYEGNMWEFINVDAVRYSRLLENRQIAFWGTHDLVSHIAGIQGADWPEIQERGRRVRRLFQDYFSETVHPAPSALVLPYVLGMILDDLAQPMNYQSGSRKQIVEYLIEAIEKREISPREKPFLLKYPPSIEKLISVARSGDLLKAIRDGKQYVSDVIEEVRHFSLRPT